MRLCYDRLSSLRPWLMGRCGGTFERLCKPSRGTHVGSDVFEGSPTGNGSSFDLIEIDRRTRQNTRRSQSRERYMFKVLEQHRRR